MGKNTAPYQNWLGGCVADLATHHDPGSQNDVRQLE
jgi:hypothetical protein